MGIVDGLILWGTVDNPIYVPLEGVVNSPIYFSYSRPPSLPAIGAECRHIYIRTMGGVGRHTGVDLRNCTVRVR